MPSGSKLRKVRAIIAIIIGGLYLLNLTAGIVELIPDVIPIVGNLDEAAATALIIYGFRELRVGRENILPTQ